MADHYRGGGILLHHAGFYDACGGATGRDPLRCGQGPFRLGGVFAAIIGNMLPVPFIVVYIRRFLQWMRRRIPVLNALADKIEKKAHLKGQKVTKYKYLGLMLFVAIPLPGTGAWTGALAAAFLDMPLRKALPSIFAGVLIAGTAVSVLTFGIASLF